jgi:hypothetical protein
MKPEYCPLDVGAMLVSTDRAQQVDEVTATYELVTDLVTHFSGGGGYQTNSKGHLSGGALCKQPNVLSPIWHLRMNKLRGLSSITCRSFWRRKLS